MRARGYDSRLSIRLSPELAKRLEAVRVALEGAHGLDVDTSEAVRRVLERGIRETERELRITAKRAR